MTEAAATGWAFTGTGRTVPYEPSRSSAYAQEQLVLARITAWTDRFGPDAYLHVLAGFTLDEAIALQDGGTTVTEQQLRVMIALTGVVLPAGI